MVNWLSVCLKLIAGKYPHEYDFYRMCHDSVSLPCTVLVSAALLSCGHPIPDLLVVGWMLDLSNKHF